MKEQPIRPRRRRAEEAAATINCRASGCKASVSGAPRRVLLRLAALSGWHDGLCKTHVELPKNWPLLLSAPMVLARRAGRKTETRRLSMRWLKVKPGDLLMVRERWRTCVELDAVRPRDFGRHYEVTSVPVQYAADMGKRNWADGLKPGRWRSSLHMPLALSRDWAEVTGVRRERLQKITEKGAIAEGVVAHLMRAVGSYPRWMRRGMRVTPPHLSAYRELWDKLNGHGSWESNPWVVVISMTKEGAH